MLSYHGDSVSRALADLFPEIGIDRKKFELKGMSKCGLVMKKTNEQQRYGKKKKNDVHSLSGMLMIEILTPWSLTTGTLNLFPISSRLR